MPDTILSLGLAVAFVLPGFLIVDLAESRRATQAARSDLELVLRGLVYALLLQAGVAITGWTGRIVTEVDGDGWQEHLGELATFGIVVGIVIPTCLGLALSWWLRNAEQKGDLRLWHYALGGRDHREAWDRVFSRLDSAFLVLTLAENGGTRYVLGKYGLGSWASQAPTSPQEIYLERVWPSDSDGVVDWDVVDRRRPRGMWISADKITHLEVLGHEEKVRSSE